MPPERIRLPSEWLEGHLGRLAAEKVAQYAGRATRYGHSSQRGNERGLKGEAATALWLDSQGYRLNTHPSTRGSDLCAGRPGPPWVMIEVKTWPVDDWASLGRDVAAVQLTKVAQNSWLVVWAIAEEVSQPDGSEYVVLAGWTPTAAIVRHGVAQWTAGVHANVRVPTEQVRSIGELVDLDVAGFEFPSVRPRDLACGHPNVLGHCWGCTEPPAGGVLPQRVTMRGGKYHEVEPKKSCISAPSSRGTAVGGSMPLFEAVVRYPACLTCFPVVRR